MPPNQFHQRNSVCAFWELGADDLLEELMHMQVLLRVDMHVEVFKRRRLRLYSDVSLGSFGANVPVAAGDADQLVRRLVLHAEPDRLDDLVSINFFFAVEDRSEFPALDEVVPLEKVAL